ncbi:MAG: methyltransferase domain-containing protein [Phycisphaeraceae bacterium]|nr:methyltransferase domain-containing protein [Phycisphaeraceae bacterium]
MQRRLSPELMDDPSLSPEALAGALAGLARLNTVSGSFGRIFREIENESKRRSGPLRVLDIACARGDFVLAAARRAGKRGMDLSFSGCDINPNSILLASEAARHRRLPCTFFVHDAVSLPLPEGFHCCVASLFLHHLEDSDVVALLQNMAQCCDFVIVNDLVRSPLNLASITLASRALTKSPIVHADAVLSARAAFTRAELRDFAVRAGLRGATIKSGGISRMMLVWRRPA